MLLFYRWWIYIDAGGKVRATCNDIVPWLEGKQKEEN